MKQFEKVARRVIPGIGSIIGHNYDPQVILKKAAEELAAQKPIMEFVNSKGWKLLSQKYKTEIINEMKRRIVYLSTNTEQNKDEIQHTSDLVGACELLLDLTGRVIKAHQEAQQTINKVRGTAGG